MQKSFRLVLLIGATVSGLLLVVHIADESTGLSKPAMREVSAVVSPLSSARSVPLKTVLTPTPTPFALSERNPTPYDVIRFVAAQHPNTFLSSFVQDQSAMGKYMDFKEQNADVNHDGRAEIVLTGRYRKYLSYLAIVAYSGQSSTSSTTGAWRELFYFETRVYACNDAQVGAQHVVPLLGDGFTSIQFLDCEATVGEAPVNTMRLWLECRQERCREVVSTPFLHPQP